MNYASALKTGRQVVPVTPLQQQILLQQQQQQLHTKKEYQKQHQPPQQHQQQQQDDEELTTTTTTTQNFEENQEQQEEQHQEEEQQDEEQQDDEDNDNEPNEVNTAGGDDTTLLATANDEDDVRQYAGFWADLDLGHNEKSFWRLFVIAGGPSVVCNMGVSCRYFYLKFLHATEVWDLVKNQLPRYIRPEVKFYVDTVVEEIDSKNAETKTEKIKTLLLKQVKSDFQKQQLLKYWLGLVAKASKVRDDEIEKLKIADPLAKKPDLDVVLKGGFSVEVNKTPLAQLRDLKQVLVWLEGLSKLVRGDKRVQLPSDRGQVRVSRVGRGGTLISFKVPSSEGPTAVLFTFDDFYSSLISAAEEYFVVVGRCKYILPNIGQKYSVNDVQNWGERETFVSAVLGHQRLNDLLSSLKNLIHKGAIPRSILPRKIELHAAERQLRSDQEVTEGENIFDFILENLPTHWDDAKKATTRITRNIVQTRLNEIEERQRLRDERRAARDAERRRRDEAAESGRPVDTEEGKTLEDTTKPEEKKKRKVIKVQEVAEDGKQEWTTIKTVVVGEEGEPVVVEPVAVEPEVKNDKKKKGEKKKKEQPQPTATSTSNPFEAVLKEGSFASASEVQYKKTLAKAKAHGGGAPKKAELIEIIEPVPTQQKKTTAPPQKAIEKKPEPQKATAPPQKATEKTPAPAQKVTEKSTDKKLSEAKKPVDNKPQQPAEKKPVEKKITDKPAEKSSKQPEKPSEKVKPVVAEKTEKKSQKAPETPKKPEKTPAKTSPKPAAKPDPKKTSPKPKKQPKQENSDTDSEDLGPAIPELEIQNSDEPEVTRSIEKPDPSKLKKLASGRKQQGNNTAKLVSIYKQEWFQPVVGVVVVVILVALGYSLVLS